MAELKPCPFCGGTATLEEYYETCDGRGDRPAVIRCKCNVKMILTFEEKEKAEKDFRYTGGYYSQNKKYWTGMHQRLIEKWNTRKPIEAVVAELESKMLESSGAQSEAIIGMCGASANYYCGEKDAYQKAISIVRGKEQP